MSARLSRLSQLAKHLRPPHGVVIARTTPFSRGLGRTIMASVDERASRPIHTAACLIIGDEVLGGKTVDTNSAYMAKWCFSLGINLKRIETIEDDEGDIMEAVKRMSERYDFVVTSGGIGPTHDDITYQSIAKAFGLPLILHEAAFERMKRLSKPHPSQPNFDWDVDSPALRARRRMVELPTDESRDLTAQTIFPHDDLWVPVAVVNGNVHILPGVPRLFERLLDGLKAVVLPRLADPEGKGIYRVLISTPLAESAVAAYLTDLAARAEPKGIKVGSYPRWEKRRNTVTLVGRRLRHLRHEEDDAHVEGEYRADSQKRDREFLESIVPEVIQNVQGRRVAVEGEDDDGSVNEADVS